MSLILKNISFLFNKNLKTFIKLHIPEEKSRKKYLKWMMLLSPYLDKNKINEFLKKLDKNINIFYNNNVSISLFLYFDIFGYYNFFLIGPTISNIINNFKKKSIISFQEIFYLSILKYKTTFFFKTLKEFFKIIFNTFIITYQFKVII